MIKFKTKIKRISTILFFSTSLFYYGQGGNFSRWQDLFSYNNVLEIRAVNKNKILAATENGLFYYDLNSGEIQKKSRVNGLSEVKISAFDFDETSQIGVIGYETGGIDILTPQGVKYLVDIPLMQNFSGSKKINHIDIKGDKVVVSVDYGVSILDLNRQEFRDTAFFPQGVKQATIFDEKVYILTNSEVKFHALDNLFVLPDTWQNTGGSGVKSLASNSQNVFYASGNFVFYGKENSFSQIGEFFPSIKNLYTSDNQIVVTEENRSTILNTQGFNVLRRKEFPYALNQSFFYENKIFAGSLEEGMIDEEGQILKPDGPYHSRAYKMSLVNDKILVSTGDRAGRYNYASYHPKNLGFYFFDGKKWHYPSYFRAKSMWFNVLDAVANPSNENEFFLTNYGDGALNQGFIKMEFDGNQVNFSKFYSTPESRPVGLTFDEEGNLFASAGYYGSSSLSAMYYYDRGQDEFKLKGFNIRAAAQKPLYHQGYLWIPTPRIMNFLAINLNQTPGRLDDDMIYTINSNNGLPATATGGTLSVSMDKKGDLWLGTSNGLRVLNNAVSEIENNADFQPIIIEEKGIGEELFRDLNILQIKTDAGNQKWVSVEGSGVFYLNETGEKTLLNFTSKNSPLPTNTITDIQIDEKNGKVYFVTDKGIVTYQGDVNQTSKNFNDVLVYPNPFLYAKHKEMITIKGLAEVTNLYITDTAGNVIHKAVAKGGYYQWNPYYNGKKLASGIYFVLMTNEDGTDKATAKIAIVQ